MFVLGKKYSRKEISQKIGGDLQGYLPVSRGHVVCACLRMDDNPDIRIGSTVRIYAGDGPVIVKRARLLAAQSNAIPVFIKRKSNAWEYIGDYVVDSHSTDPAALATAMKRAGRPVRHVIDMRPIRP